MASKGLGTSPDTAIGMLAVRGGTVVNAAGPRTPDVGIGDGRLGAVGDVGAADEELDAAELVVLSEDPTEDVAAGQTPDVLIARDRRY